MDYRETELIEEVRVEVLEIVNGLESHDLYSVALGVLKELNTLILLAGTRKL